MTARVSRLLALVLYAAVAVGGTGLHLLEFASHDHCAACHSGPQSASLLAQCGDGPCHDATHNHHNHPVHVHEDGCVTCSALGGQQSEAPAPPEIAQVLTEAAIRPAPRLVSSTPAPLHLGRAPPAA